MIERSPRRAARTAGAFYVVTIVLGLIAAFTSGRLSDVSSLVATACYVVITILLYYILRPVSQGLSMLAALFSLAGCTFSILDTLHLVSLHFNYIVFFGFYCLILGYLIIRSTFFPPAIGVLLLLAGANYFTFLSPTLAHRLTPYNYIPGLLAEGALTAWLLVVGLDETRWKELSSHAHNETIRTSSG